MRKISYLLIAFWCFGFSNRGNCSFLDTIVYQTPCTSQKATFIKLGYHKYLMIEEFNAVVVTKCIFNNIEALTPQRVKYIYQMYAGGINLKYGDSAWYYDQKGKLLTRVFVKYQYKRVSLYDSAEKIEFDVFCEKDYNVIEKFNEDKNDKFSLINRFKNSSDVDSLKIYNDGELFLEQKKNGYFVYSTYHKKGKLIQANLKKMYLPHFQFKNLEQLDLINYPYISNSLQVTYNPDYTIESKIEKIKDTLLTAYYGKDGTLARSYKSVLTIFDERYTREDTNKLYYQLMNSYEAVSYYKSLTRYSLVPTSTGMLVSYFDSSSAGVFTSISTLPFMIKSEGKFICDPYQIMQEYYLTTIYKNGTFVYHDTIKPVKSVRPNTSYFKEPFFYLAKEGRSKIYDLKKKPLKPKEDIIQSELRIRDTSLMLKRSFYPRLIYPNTEDNKGLSSYNLKVKKDFKSCLFGVWNTKNDTYLIAPNYFEIIKTGKEFSQIYKCSKPDLSNDYYNANGEFKINLPHDVRLIQPYGNKFSFYTAYISDSLIVFDKLLNIILKRQAIKSRAYIRDYFLVLKQKEGEKYMITSLLDKSVTYEMGNPLNKITHGFYQMGNDFYMADSFKLKKVLSLNSSHKSPNKRTLVGTTKNALVRINYSQYSSSINVNWIKMDTADKWYKQNISNPSYRYQQVPVASNTRFLGMEYSLNGKMGILKKNLTIFLKPEWDAVNENGFAKKEGRKYLVLNNGSAILFPYEVVPFYPEYTFLNSSFVIGKSKEGVKYLYALRGTSKQLPIKEFGFLLQKRKGYGRNSEITISAREFYALDTSNRLLERNYSYYYPIKSKELIVFTNALTGKSQLYSGNTLIPKSFDDIQHGSKSSFINPFIPDIWPNLRMKSGDVMYKLGPTQKDFIKVQNMGLNEKEIGGKRYGYTLPKYRLYMNDCGSINYLPEGITLLKLLSKSYQRQYLDDLMLISTAKDYYSSTRYHSADRLYNASTKKVSAYKVRSISQFKENYIVKDSRGFVHLINSRLEEQIPIHSITRLTPYYNYYWVVQNSTNYLYYPKNKDIDTLMPNIYDFQNEYYVTKKNKNFKLYTYSNQLIVSGSYYFIQKLGSLKAVDVPIDNLIKSYSGYNSGWRNGADLSPLQLSFLKGYQITNSYNSKKALKVTSISATKFPSKAEFEKVFPLKNDSYDGEDYEMDEEVMIDYPRDRGMGNAGYGRSIYQPNYDMNEFEFFNTKASYNKVYEQGFQRLIGGRSIQLHKTQFLENNFIELHNGSYKNSDVFLVELKDTGYQLYSLFDLVDTANYVNLANELRNQISLSPDLWGVKCEADLDKYNMGYFADIIRFSGRGVGLKGESKAFVLIDAEKVKPFIKPKYQFLFKTGSK